MNRRTIQRIATHTGTTLAAVLLTIALGAAPAFAEPPIATELQTATELRTAADPQILAVYSLPQIITNITTWVVGILAGVATLFLTIGGLRYLAAGGDPTEVEKAKSAFKSALIGYALAILAPVLLGIVRGWIGG
ncbi:pilin [Cryptosporangium minutisporangium]|uniref:TrbC/VIRB2 family protein n=1 Tax=Cryptosporangium minutisporangium TaxID=113569 RepID=A0ABP6SYM2_9ACTN